MRHSVCSPPSGRPSFSGKQRHVTSPRVRAPRERDTSGSVEEPVRPSTHHFQTIDALRTEVEDARVYGSDHWETGGTDGTDLGDDLAKAALHDYFERS